VPLLSRPGEAAGTIAEQRTAPGRSPRAAVPGPYGTPAYLSAWISLMIPPHFSP
jgi:hypothetical protein